ncbi:Gfo/Idh/MocA family protein [Cohnella laeviribosi]|uniref:Gfo/Idh/MocA family protein n=1 Tax=Cohnella laeviribosi TaxID=380174 RepID=UPI0003744AEF|nr:Gfo/Idh/MocA family oxidoreductase [Cohnella laeviribosi]
MKKLKIGIIGCGGIANNKHMPSLAKLNHLAEMVAFCDIIHEKAVSAAQKFGTPDAKVYTDYRELLANEEVDVVHICTPNVSHREITVAAFAAGKHVMCEKPMAHTAEDAQHMIDAWKKSGKMFTIGYQNRFRPEVQMLKNCCENGELGEIYYGKAHAVRRRAVPNWGVFLDKDKQGGGPLIDIGTHALDLTLWFMDNYEPYSVSGTVFHKLGSLPEAVGGNMWGPWDHTKYEVEDSAFGYVKMKNGALIYIEASWALNILESKEASATLCGTKAGAEIRSGMSYPVDNLIFNRVKAGMLVEESLTPKGNVAYFEGVHEPPGIAEARQWLTAIIEDREPLVKPEQTFVVTKILDAVYRSAREGKEIILG